MGTALIQALRQPGHYPHPVEGVEVIETHISWVLLAGAFAYKIRKPVNLGFLDFTTLASRRFDCEEELRLNRRLAPELYLDLVTIRGCEQCPRLRGDGDPIEYAVRMHRFAQEALLSHRQAQGRLSGEEMDALAEALAEFHRQAPAADPDGPFGRIGALESAMAQNFVALEREPSARAQLDSLRAWSDERLRELRPLLIDRRVRGRVREGHGDLHLGNIVKIDGRIRPFDCITFDPELRWLDCLNDLAFVLMDLDHRGEAPLARRLLDHYLQAGGDFDGVPLLPLFKAYRALVRAKVALLTQGGPGPLADCQSYLELASGYTFRPSPRLVLMQGMSGSGKSWLSGRLLEAHGGIRLRSDVERKRLCREPGHLYDPATTRRVYAELRRLARPLLQAGCTVIVDATFIKAGQRRPFLELARDLDLPVHLICCTAESERLDQRIQQRRRESRDPSDATPSVRRAQQQQTDSLSEAEKTIAWRVDSREPGLVERLGQSLWGK